MEYSDEFRKHYSELTDFDKYWETVQKYLPQCIRVNTLKISVSDLKKRLKGWRLESIPWIKEGFWISGSRRDLGNLYEHKLGYFYCQESVSMLPALALKPKGLVLDICAAPGSKTTQMAAMMKNKGLIVANDVDYKRIVALSANIQRCGVSNCVITNHNGMHLKGYPKKCKSFLGPSNQNCEGFDKILLDAPCTGYGTIRGETGNSIRNLKNWNLGASKQMSGIQKGLIVKAFDLLKSGGEMIYSTCSLEPIEDEHIVEYLLGKRSNAKLINTGLDVKSKVNVKGFEKCLKVWPQFYDNEGFFVCKIKKEKI